MPTRRKAASRRKRKPTIAAMPRKEWRAALRQGKEQAHVVLEERRRRSRRRRGIRPQGLTSPGQRP